MFFKTRYKPPKRKITLDRICRWLFCAYVNFWVIYFVIPVFLVGLYLDDYDDFNGCYKHLMFIAQVLKENGYEDWSDKIIAAFTSGNAKKICYTIERILLFLKREPFVKKLNLHNDVKKVWKFFIQRDYEAIHFIDKGLIEKDFEN